MKGIMKSNN